MAERQACALLTGECDDVKLYGTSDTEDEMNVEDDLAHQTRVIEAMEQAEEDGAVKNRRSTCLRLTSSLDDCTSCSLKVCRKYCRLEIVCVSCISRGDPAVVNDIIGSFRPEASQVIGKDGIFTAEENIPEEAKDLQARAKDLERYSLRAPQQTILPTSFQGSHGQTQRTRRGRGLQRHQLLLMLLW